MSNDKSKTTENNTVDVEEEEIFEDFLCYTKMIANGMSCKKDEVSDVCLCITLSDTQYNMAFIDYENDNCLGVNYTATDGTERFVVINKDHIIDIAVVYQQDMENDESDDDSHPEVLYQ